MNIKCETFDGDSSICLICNKYINPYVYLEHSAICMSIVLQRPPSAATLADVMRGQAFIEDRESEVTLKPYSDRCDEIAEAIMERLDSYPELEIFRDRYTGEMALDWNSLAEMTTKSLGDELCEFIQAFPCEPRPAVVHEFINKIIRLMDPLAVFKSQDFYVNCTDEEDSDDESLFIWQQQL